MPTAREILRQCTPSEAAADLTAGCIFVTEGASGVDATALGGRAHGILHNQPDTGDAAGYATAGAVMPVRASAAIAKGDLVASAAGGEAKTAAGGEHVNGVALSAAAASGDLIAVLFLPSGVL